MVYFEVFQYYLEKELDDSFQKKISMAPLAFYWNFKYVKVTLLFVDITLRYVVNQQELRQECFFLRQELKFL